MRSWSLAALLTLAQATCEGWCDVEKCEHLIGHRRECDTCATDVLCNPTVFDAPLSKKTKSAAKGIEKSFTRINYEDAFDKCPVLTVGQYKRLKLWETEVQTPTIIRGLVKHWDAMKKWERKDMFQERFSNHSFVKARVAFLNMDGKLSADESIELSNYLEISDKSHTIVMDDHRVSAAEDLLLTDLFKDCHVPSAFARMTAARVLSIGGSSGVQFQRHCAAWIGLVAGHKRWHLIPPSEEGVEEFWRPCDAEYKPILRERICDIFPGDVIYLPDNWWHATCNLKDWTIGMGTQCWVHEAPVIASKDEV